MAKFNASQPDRPEETVDGTPLYYRTQPKNIKRIPNFFTPHYIISSLRLYRAARAGQIPESVAIGELYDFVFANCSDLVSKKTMGSTVVHAVIYEPRLLKNSRAVGGALMTYQFRNISDLIYGLEWQICAALYAWMNRNGEWPTDQAEWKPLMEKTLDEIAELSEKEFVDLYEKDMIEQCAYWKEPPWREKIAQYSERAPVHRIKRQEIERPAPTPPRDLSRF